ncbi:hypothetical protein [Bacillus sp. SD088]|nr:hypothetical protein [Bacillus sp. SD088]MBO0991843.1 hypothetical protein [Bacillus sp. SD088]
MTSSYTVSNYCDCSLRNFLDAFHYSGSGDTEDMNAEDRWWIDIRQ